MGRDRERERERLKSIMHVGGRGSPGNAARPSHDGRRKAASKRNLGYRFFSRVVSAAVTRSCCDPCRVRRRPLVQRRGRGKKKSHGEVIRVSPVTPPLLRRSSAVHLVQKASRVEGSEELKPQSSRLHREFTSNGKGPLRKDPECICLYKRRERVSLASFPTPTHTPSSGPETGEWGGAIDWSMASVLWVVVVVQYKRKGAEGAETNRRPNEQVPVGQQLPFPFRKTKTSDEPSQGRRSSGLVFGVHGV